MAVKMVAGQPNSATRNGLSREDEILIHCARLDLSQARREAIKDLLSRGLDWDLLLEKAAWHRLSCLVSYHLRSTNLSAFVPQPVIQKLKNANHFNLARNMILQDELSQLMVAFNKERIPVIVLKGAALLGSVYQDISLRPMSDLDILVQPEYLDRAEAIAFRQGYVYIESRNTQKHSRTELRHLANLMHVKKNIMLEIHQHIVDPDSPYHFELNSFWSRSHPITVSGVSALTLSPEDLLIHLNINFLLDRRYRGSSALGQLCDISEVILHYGDSLDWHLLETTAREHSVAPVLHCVLYACQQLLGTQVPSGVLAHLMPLGFNPSIATLFIHRRVLDTKPWVSFNLIAPKSRYSQFRALLAIAKKSILIPKRIFQEQGFRRRVIYYYFRRIKDMLCALGRFPLRREELKQDLLLDRWLHDIYRFSNGNRPRLE